MKNARTHRSDLRTHFLRRAVLTFGFLLICAIGLQSAYGQTRPEEPTEINLSGIDLATLAGQVERDRRAVTVALPICERAVSREKANMCLNRAVREASRCRPGHAQPCTITINAKPQPARRRPNFGPRSFP